MFVTVRRAASLAVLATMVMGIGVGLSASAAAKTTITVWMWNKDIGDVVEGFQRKYPDIEVKTMISEWNDFHDKLLTAMVGGAGVPDVTGLEIKYMPRFVGAGTLLTPLDSFGAQKYKDSFVNFRWRLATSKGKLFAMPIDVGPIATWYRPGALAAAGLPSDPTSVTQALGTWDDLFALSKKLVKDTNGDGKPDRFSLSSGTRLAELMGQQLAARMLDENLKVVMDNEDMDKWSAAWKAGKAFRDAGYEAAFGDRTDTRFQTALRTDKMAFTMEAIWNGVWIRPLKGQWGVAPLPGGVGANDGGSFLAIPAAAKHKDAAYKFIQYVCTNVASQAKLMEQAYWFPAYIPAYSDAYFQEPAAWCSNQKYLQVFAQSAISTKYIPVTRHETNAKAIVDAELKRVMDGKDIRVAIRDAAANVRRSSRGAN